jgi:hypothetical protein
LWCPVRASQGPPPDPKQVQTGLAVSSDGGAPGPPGTDRLPPRWQRIDWITGRSPTVQAVGGWFIHQSPAIRRHRDRPGVNDGISRWPSGAGVLAAGGSHPRTRMGPLVARRAHTPLDRLQRPVHPATASTASPCCSTAAARRSPGIPCGQRRTFGSGSQPQPGPFPHQPPAADPKLGPHPLHRPPLLHMPRPQVGREVLEAELGQPRRPPRLPPHRLHLASGLGARPLRRVAPQPSDPVLVQQPAHRQPMRGQLRRHLGQQPPSLHHRSTR